MKLSESAPILISLAALILSVLTFVQAKQDREELAEELKPRVGHQIKVPGQAERYGFFLENRGGKRAVIANFETGYSKDGDPTKAETHLTTLDFTRKDYALANFGPKMILEPGEVVELFTFNKELDTEKTQIWFRYISHLAADICYCDLQFESCLAHRVSTRQESSPSKFACNAKNAKSRFEAAN